MWDRKQIMAAAGVLGAIALVVGVVLGTVIRGGDSLDGAAATAPSDTTTSEHTEDGGAADAPTSTADEAPGEKADEAPGGGEAAGGKADEAPGGGEAAERDGTDTEGTDTESDTEGTDTESDSDDTGTESDSDDTDTESDSDGTDTESDSDGTDDEPDSEGIPSDVLEDLAESIPDPVEEGFDTPLPDFDLDLLPTTSPCDTGTFRRGHWDEDGTGGSSADLRGIQVDTVGDDPDCIRMRVTFDGAVPDFEVASMSPLWHTTLSFDGDTIPYGPIDPDVFRARDGELVDTAMVTHDRDGLGVFASHSRRSDVAVRAQVEADHIDVFLRPSQPDDETVDDDFSGEPVRRVVRGLPDRNGLALTYLVELAPGELFIGGFAAAPESHVEVHVHDDEGEVCTRNLMAEGPMYLLSRFTTSCELEAGTYDVVVGWPSPTGDPADDVWYLTAVDIRG